MDVSLLILYAAEEISFEYSILKKSSTYQVRNDITMFINVTSMIRCYM